MGGMIDSSVIGGICAHPVTTTNVRACRGLIGRQCRSRPGGNCDNATHQIADQSAGDRQ